MSLALIIDIIGESSQLKIILGSIHGSNSDVRWYHGCDFGTVHGVSSGNTFMHSSNSPVAAHR